MIGTITQNSERNTNFSPHHWCRVKAIYDLLFTIDYFSVAQTTGLIGVNPCRKKAEYCKKRVKKSRKRQKIELKLKKQTQC